MGKSLRDKMNELPATRRESILTKVKEMTHEHLVYIYDEHDNEIEVDMELLEDGFPYGLLTVNGTEIRLSSEQEQKAYIQHRENMEEREAYKSDYYNEW